jgi:hypothetical protein
VPVAGVEVFSLMGSFRCFPAWVCGESGQ